MPKPDTTPKLLLSLAVILLLIAGLPVLGLANSGLPDHPHEDPRHEDPRAEILEHGAELYAFHCSTCHGASGLGLEEARLHFPANHAQCERCHVPRNPPQMTQAQMDANQTAFSLGDPPAVNNASALARFGSAGTLYRYLQATMPRWSPGRLTDDGYLAVTAYLLDNAGLLAADVGLDLAAFDALPLVEGD